MLKSQGVRRVPVMQRDATKGKRGRLTNVPKGKDVDKLLTQRHATIYIYIYIHAVKLLSGPSLALSGIIIWSK